MKSASGVSVCLKLQSMPMYPSTHSQNPPWQAPRPLQWLYLLQSPSGGTCSPRHMPQHSAGVRGTPMFVVMRNPVMTRAVADPVVLGLRTSRVTSHSQGVM